MLQLILTVLSIALMASLALATVSYAPSWLPAAEHSYVQTRRGFEKLEQAFLQRAAQNDGAAPPVDASREDGGLAPAFGALLGFVPRAPVGYAWKYGFTSESQLAADGYAGHAGGGLHWFCLYTTGPGASHAAYRGIRRSQQHFALAQFYLNLNGAMACGRAVETGAPSSFPSPVAVTLFVRYAGESL